MEAVKENNEPLNVLILQGLDKKMQKQLFTGVLQNSCYEKFCNSTLKEGPIVGALLSVLRDISEQHF